MKLSFQDADPAHWDFQYLEDLSTAYWYSEVLFAGLELKLFDFLEQGCRLEELAVASGCRTDELLRLLKVMERLEIVHCAKGVWFNSQAARLYLVSASPSYMGDFFLYRRHMKSRWGDLVEKVVEANTACNQPLSSEDDYILRTFHYVRAMDQLARQKAPEIAELLSRETWEPPILDVGGGAGALGRELIRTKLDGYSTLFELPEVIGAARTLYPDQKDWDKVQVISGDFRFHEFKNEETFGLIILGNFLHAYGSEESRSLLHKAVDLLSPDGMLLIHDYFPDRIGGSPQKGPLYDLNMMLNTYDGECHEASRIVEWLNERGICGLKIRDLSSDSSIILASLGRSLCDDYSNFDDRLYAARQIGFRQAKILPVKDVVTASWVRLKCKCGCAGYGKNLQCPPHGMDHGKTAEMLNSYEWALVVEGMPPGREFHERLLQLEKQAFLAGFYKAFVFGAGPCSVCPSCPGEGRCLNPDKARPSMEGSGIDVYQTARNAGISLKPVIQRDRYVKYIGLLLLE